VYRILVEKPEGSTRCRCENNIIMGLEEIGWGGMDRIGTGGGFL
jgi:hypothetical protein